MGQIVCGSGGQKEPVLVASDTWTKVTNVKAKAKRPELKSTITCPHCGHRQIEQMPTKACQFFWDCPGCGEVLKPKEGDCCVFCSYGTVPCPPIQLGEDCCD